MPFYSTFLVDNSESKSTVGVVNDLDLIHCLNDIVGTVGIDLVPGVGGTDCNNGCSGCDTGFDTRR